MQTYNAIHKIALQKRAYLCRMRKLHNDELGRKSSEEFREAEKLPLVLVLDNVRSLNNVGSVFRTADAFLLEALYLCGYTGTPPHREIQKTALGATESVRWKHFPSIRDAIDELKAEGYAVYAVEQTEKSISLEKFQPQEKTALVFGNEVEGVQQEAIDACAGSIEIPQFGTKHSFNIAVSVGIVVWEVWRKKTKF